MLDIMLVEQNLAQHPILHQSICYLKFFICYMQSGVIYDQ